MRVEKKYRHFWSPQLSILLEKNEEENLTLMKGVYGPMTNVWTIFTVSYLALGVLFTFSSIIGFSQKALGLYDSILWILPILLIIALILYISSQMGQNLGAAQIYAMHYFLENVLGEKIPE